MQVHTVTEVSHPDSGLNEIDRDISLFGRDHSFPINCYLKTIHVIIIGSLQRGAPEGRPLRGQTKSYHQSIEQEMKER